MGQYSYATVQWVKQAHPAVKPAAAIGGIVADTAITVADTVAVPAASVPVAAWVSYWGGCPQPLDFENHPFRDTIGRPLLFPIFFPMWYPINLFALSYGGGLGPVEPGKRDACKPSENLPH